MKLTDAIRQAVQNRDANLAGKVADTLRFRCGMSYQETYEFVNQRSPIDLRDWEAMMYEADTDTENINQFARR